MLLRGHYRPSAEQDGALATFLQPEIEGDLEQIAFCLTELQKHCNLKPQAVRVGVNATDTILSLMELSLGFDGRALAGPASSSAEHARLCHLRLFRQAMQRILAKVTAQKQSEPKTMRNLDSSIGAAQVNSLFREALSEEDRPEDGSSEQAREEEDILQTVLAETLALCGFVDFCAKAHEHLSKMPKGRKNVDQVIDKLRILPQKVRAKRLRVLMSGDDALTTAEAWHKDAERQLHIALEEGTKKPKKKRTKTDAVEEIWKTLNTCLQD